MTWFVAHTLARAEAMADHHLRRAGYETLYLHRLVTIRHARRAEKAIRPYMTRYVLFDARPDQGLYAAANAIGVSSIVGTRAGPLEVPGPVVAELRGRGDRYGHVTEQVVEDGRRRYDVGAEVRVTAGPLEGFLAFVALDSGSAVRVWLRMFGRQIEVPFDPTGLQASASADAR